VNSRGFSTHGKVGSIKGLGPWGPPTDREPFDRSGHRIRWKTSHFQGLAIGRPQDRSRKSGWLSFPWVENPASRGTIQSAPLQGEDYDEARHAAMATVLAMGNSQAYDEGAIPEPIDCSPSEHSCPETGHNES